MVFKNSATALTPAISVSAKSTLKWLAWVLTEFLPELGWMIQLLWKHQRLPVPACGWHNEEWETAFSIASVYLVKSSCIWKLFSFTLISFGIFTSVSHMYWQINSRISLGFLQIHLSNGFLSSGFVLTDMLCITVTLLWKHQRLPVPTCGWHNEEWETAFSIASVYLVKSSCIWELFSSKLISFDLFKSLSVICTDR